MAEGPERGATSVRDSDGAANEAGHLTTLAERELDRDRQRQTEQTCDSMRFTAALRRFIAPSKHKMCPTEKRAHAWVHPHFTFTAGCRLNRPTFPDFLIQTTFRLVFTDPFSFSPCSPSLFHPVTFRCFHFPLFAFLTLYPRFSNVFNFPSNCKLIVRVRTWRGNLILCKSDVLLMIQFL